MTVLFLSRIELELILQNYIETCTGDGLQPKSDGL